MVIGIPLMILTAVIIYFAVVGIRKTLAEHLKSNEVVLIRDLLKYASLLISVLITSFGLSGILGILLAHNQLKHSERLELARWLAFIVVGIPILILIGRWISKDLKKNESALEYPAWQIYLLAASTASFLLWFIPIHSFLRFFAGDKYRPNLLAQIIISLIVWAIHLLLIKNRNAILINTHRFIGWFAGFTSATIGVITFVDFGFVKWFKFESGQYQIAEATIALIIGSITCLYYWHEFNKKANRTELHFYRLFGGIGAPSLFFIIAAIYLLNTTLTWFYGTTTQPAKTFFHDSTQQGSVVIVLSFVLGYFLILLKGYERDEIKRFFQYITCAALLIAASVGVAITIAGSMARFDRANIIIFGISLTFITASYWALIWFQSQKSLHKNWNVESSSPFRRIYLYFFIGVPGLIAIGASVWLTYNLFKELLIRNQELWQSRIPIAGLVTTLIVGTAHALILRRERLLSMKMNHK